MTSLKLSEFEAAEPLDGSEIVGLVQEGANVQSTTADIAALGGGIGGGATVLFADAEDTPLTVDLMQTSGHTEVGIGNANYSEDATFDPIANPGFGFPALDGRIFRLNEPFLTPEMFGAIPGNYPDGIGDDWYNAWQELQEYQLWESRNVAIAAYRGAREVQFHGNQYYSTETLQLKSAMRMRGMGMNRPGGIPTMLRFAANKAGIVVNRYNTLGDAEASPTTTGGDGSIIEGFYLYSAGGTPDRLKSGIRMRANATVRDCLLAAFPGAGVCISADASVAASDPYHGNANCWRLDSIRCQVNKYGGVFVSGGDANAGVGINVDCTQNARYGIQDSAFLGNTWIGPHCDGNGLYNIAGVLETSVVSHGGNRYYLVNGQDALGAVTEPGTDSTVWVLMGAGGTHANVPAWTALLSYVSGGAYLHTGSANMSQWIGAYTEGGQAPPQMLGACTVSGGFMGNGLRTGSPHLIGSASQGLKSQRRFTQQVTLDDGTSATVSSGGLVVGQTLPFGTWGSANATPSNPGLLSALTQNGDTGDLYWDSVGLRNPLRLTGYSTGRTYGGRTQIESRYTTEVDKLALGTGAGAGNNSKVVVYADAAAASGNLGRGDILLNALPAAAGKAGWSVTTGGVAGSTAVQKPFGAIDA